MSPWCEAGDHDACWHRDVGGVRLLGRNRGPFVQLCPCACHDGCPISGEVPDAEWAGRCTCPGAEEARRFDAELRVESEERRDRWNEARSAAAARADAGEPFEVALADELRQRGIDVRPGLVAHLARVRRARRAPVGTRSILGLAALARGGFDAIRALRSGLVRDDED